MQEGSRRLGHGQGHCWIEYSDLIEAGTLVLVEDAYDGQDHFRGGFLKPKGIDGWLPHCDANGRVYMKRYDGLVEDLAIEDWRDELMDDMPLQEPPLVQQGVDQAPFSGGGHSVISCLLIHSLCDSFGA